MANHLLFLVLLAVACSCAIASDPSLLQDVCVADKTSPGIHKLVWTHFVSTHWYYEVNLTCMYEYIHAVQVNGFACKDAMDVAVEDFYFSGLDKVGNTSNKQSSAVTPVNVAQIPGLNTMGISMVRIDYAPNGMNPPHTHPRATEILTVLEGSLFVGFVTSNPNNTLITKVLNKGDVFVFPKGLVHFQFNNGTGNAVALAGLSSQNPGVITIANTVFGSKPSIADNIIAKAFQVDKETVDLMQAQF
ncbi:hypothetical protein PVAP13_1NG214138 [Panicum virgatum]|jgi:quercetin dioxygenase-like cupin family protein|uniref:Germin-like protein n=1 Tax=Panicum virgatum TaxID=38727 RepID=A0A8T0WUJ8_PANVG|nr:hypothetical protein PVAP13_1NG214138 [Panicum virgatum]